MMTNFVRSICTNWTGPTDNHLCGFVVWWLSSQLINCWFLDSFSQCSRCICFLHIHCHCSSLASFQGKCARTINSPFIISGLTCSMRVYSPVLLLMDVNVVAPIK
jgi:hypothetical protein